MSKPLHIDVITLFPGMFEGPLTQSIVQRAQDRGFLSLCYTNPRDFTSDPHRTVDDRPYGGGAGMILRAEPLVKAISRVRRKGSRVILLSPQGKPFTQRMAKSLSKERRLIFVCGHYEGIDERALDFVDDEISIGDYVLTGGELPAMVVIDAITRLIPGVLAKADAAVEESFTGDFLDFPQYTRPSRWRGRAVPPILLSGDHAKVTRWRRQAALEATKRKRPELLKMVK